MPTPRSDRVKRSSAPAELFPMRTRTFVRRTTLPVSAQEAFAWHERPGAFPRLAPPWEKITILREPVGVADGATAEFLFRLGPFRQRWVAVHQGCEPGRKFQDVQRRGPFALWEHTHTILPETDDSCVLEDSIEHAPPLGALGWLAAGRMIARTLASTFAYRHRITADDLRAHEAARSRGAPPMRILVSGASGLVGSTLIPMLTTGGHDVLRLVRKPSADPREISWNPDAGTIDADRLDGIDAVVHLAGENIAERRWTDAVRKRIRDSRVNGTSLLANAVASLDRPPRAFVCASAIGYYGDRGDDPMTESSPPGTGFLPEVCQAWEAACQPARDKGIRTVNLRIGVILTPKGAALKKMLFPFKMGAGGVIGSGRQYWSWVAIDDVVGAIHHALTRDDVNGPVNVVSPNPVTNRVFTKTLGKVLRRPTLLPMPAFAARLALGEMADDLLLASNRILPQKLQETGYQFRCPELEGALRHLLGRP